jgi:hypothetical protein
MVAPWVKVVKDERSTSNAQRPTSKIAFYHFFMFFSAVRMLVAKILINSSVSAIIVSILSGGFTSGTR